MKLLIALLALSLMGCEKEPEPIDYSGYWMPAVIDEKNNIAYPLESCEKYRKPELDWAGWQSCFNRRIEAHKIELENLIGKTIDFKDSAQ